MSVLDEIVDVFLGGPDDWAARLQPVVSLVSPEGNEFEAKWRGDSRSVDKKLGIFFFPKIKGNIVQDLAVNSVRYTIPLYFDGKDCDLNAKAFFNAARETGRWVVTHPVHGFLELQLIKATENDQLVTDGGIIDIPTEWIEPIDETTLLTAAEAASAVSGGIDELNSSAFDQFTEALDSSTEALSNAINTTVQGIANVTDVVLSPLTTSVDYLDNTMNLIQNGINDTLAATVLDVESLAGQMQQLITTPSLATTSMEQSQSLYNELASAYTEFLPSDSDGTATEKANDAVIVELCLSAALSAFGTIAVNGIKAAQAAGVTIPTTTTVLTSEPIATRAQAVEAAQNSADFFTSMTDSLDTIQTQFEDEDIDNQYFAQPASYASAAQLASKTVQFLLISSFNLKVERRFVLDRPRSPVEIAMTEYKGPGNNDANINLFIRSNKLKDDEIYLLPAGREVIIYV
jgi:prophage DNA circulation protein